MNLRITRLSSTHQGQMQDFGHGTVIRFSSLSGLNSLINQVLNKNIKIISFIY
jgi:hypothetical protein